MKKKPTTEAAGWVDVSVPIRNGMHSWPGDPAAVVSLFAGHAKGDVCQVSAIHLSSHCGTHMDAPLHFLSEGKTMDELPWDAVLGPVRVIEIRDSKAIRVEELRKLKPQEGERILFKTRNSRHSWGRESFDKNFVYISKEAARFLAKSGVRTVGVDYCSVGGFYKDGVETHRALLGAEIWIIEGLNLSAVHAGNYEMICLPIRLEGGDGAPARCLLRRMK